MTASIVEQLDPIFRPKSIAVVGASKSPAKWGGMVLGRLVTSPFRGGIYPVHPSERTLFGLEAYPDVLAIPHPVDRALFTIPAAQIPASMESCVKKGIRGAVIISADFAETGERGRVLQEQTVRIARAGGLRFVGPNGNGIWTAAVGLNASPLPTPAPGPIAFLSQSGMFGGVAIRYSMRKGLGLSKVVSMGNQADLTVSDYLEYLVEDEHTKVIAIYMEGFRDGPRFVEVARRVSRRKPIVILKGGSSPLGARATLTHTASIAGEDRVFQGVCRQAGLIRATQLEDVFVMAEALACQPLPRGGRIAVVGNGGQGVTTVDNLATLGLDVPAFREEDRQALKELLPPHAPVPNNPVDFAAGAFQTRDEVGVVERLASLDYIDGVITNVPMERVFSASLAERKREVIAAVEDFTQIPRKYGKPLVTQKGMPSELVEELLRSAGVPMYDTPRESALAMNALVRYAAIQGRS